MDAPWLEEQRQRDLERELAPQHFSKEQYETLTRLDRRWATNGLAQRTRELKAKMARQFARFLKKPFEDATREDIETFLAQVTPTSAVNTQENVKRFLKSFYKDLLAPEEDRHPKLVSWIKLRNPFKSSKLPKDLLTLDEVKRIAAATTHLRDRALVLILYETAARASELIAARIGDVTFDQYGARITLSGKTGERKVRLINSVPDLQAWLETHPSKEDPEGPLFVSWGAQNRYQALLYTGVWRIVYNACKLAGINKHVHPHLFRHSRLTELAKQLSEAELKVFAGWAGGSQMAKVYVHLGGDDVDRKLLEKAGLLKGEDQPKPDPLKTRTCQRCGTPNSPTSRYCTKCTLPLDEAERLREENLMARLQAKLPLLARILEDPGLIDKFSGQETVEGRVPLSAHPPTPSTPPAAA
ncbi:MAG: tyrosine-type recombinase/integrase [Euryarchaeota archaeon]|nr:tyrosine-type recombinase/integrase [Euryarchaeota archaeon]